MRLAPHESLFAPPRATCIDGPRPCERRCRYRLAGRESCALDVVAERGPLTLDETAELFGLTRSRVQQLERSALATLRVRAARVGLAPGSDAS